jgi:hypothetical protein
MVKKQENASEVSYPEVVGLGLRSGALLWTTCGQGMDEQYHALHPYSGR